ncbi:bifunctional histidinol-phosphatase/imidazoleglycerol-phosphate dehydratase HisB [Legionella micdadei]|uniref:Histidine biosynthesis bifunctional protein HisB n=1 Tax=Legionella micdadei TaxID=451 RepID=A0A098GFJ4_LEGMI|nr:bifunctional histidinol-phosphatase/imidazoleglycerol-phosphate dehydratase HisB [Legionella micdadei]ARG97304.1 bifunctional imidazole glycerol-phosphate dehydratase/histidinol phosphatase [Legionella micdadei]ARH00389.1 bifunctional imidazole glycerol-phosphate dehydratase/histidinol phosphatase [Legionella micdadei]KTD28184.1 histidinol-phosphatase/imisazoleglycerol- phosphat e dehydratase [Legionella micdadei]NSL16813.1 bifunctional histidinol-phosphatase/imidazoleglycerol-phosphate dehy
MQKILFIDRDGTLVKEPADFQVDDLSKIRLCQGVIPALLSLSKAGFTLVMVSNQDGLGTNDFPQTSFQQCHEFILDLFTSQGIHFNEIFICPHRENDYCQCRKPKTGLLDSFLLNTIIDRNQSWVIGDRESDKELAQNIGISFLPVSREHTWQQIVETILFQQRSASIKRQTKETSIEVSLNLDTETPCRISTPIGFFSHMLEQIARHGGFSLQVKAQGDTEVDEHHLVEDTALALGEALKKALRDKWGIARYGFTLPMDEALATVVVDLSGRSHCVFEGQFTREFVGGMATEMVPHFFNSLASSLGATLHVNVKGQNHHHMIEACFKALGRALRQACARCDNSLPSTKGIL